MQQAGLARGASSCAASSANAAVWGPAARPIGVHTQQPSRRRAGPAARAANEPQQLQHLQQQHPAAAAPLADAQPQQQGVQLAAAAALLVTQQLGVQMRALGAWCRTHRLHELLLGCESMRGAAMAAAVPVAAMAAMPALPGGGISDLFTNRVFLAGFWGWFTAQALKIFTKRLKKGVWDVRAIVDSGGMPSSHSALCAGITTAVAFQHGLGSAAFAMAVAFSSIVMYDAAGVRRHAGKQAEVLNQVISELLHGHPVSQTKLKEVLGHTPLQVCCGAMLGVLFGIFFPATSPAVLPA